MSVKIYRGLVDSAGNLSVVILEHGNTRALPFRFDLDNHSPTGFAWGYGGSGPAQLALALLADALDDDTEAVVLHQRFKWKFVATLPIDKPWQMSIDEVLDKARLVAREVAANL